eukprot:CAMPEP_0173076006 /NCGR_PEP_ID=MMETSP1102-20130122/12074_1 /TAXON_ID=49646 /ORGANISM="Geminigera sp., Strain Caron Lab Isolate" /LENGTH=158 /DNA_ID=CAMNT_0013945621 /DNA_START=924 /DNA_END=1397 /DNA_ORIENTATION=-
MPRSLQSTFATAPSCWHTCPSSLGCPGRQYHSGLFQIATNAMDATDILHNDNLNTTLPEEAHASLKAYLADATNSSPHDEVAQHLLYPVFNMIVPAMGVELYGSQQADHYTHVHNYFHAKLCEVFEVDFVSPLSSLDIVLVDLVPPPPPVHLVSLQKK